MGVVEPPSTPLKLSAQPMHLAKVPSLGKPRLTNLRWDRPTRISRRLRFRSIPRQSSARGRTPPASSRISPRVRAWTVLSRSASRRPWRLRPFSPSPRRRPRKRQRGRQRKTATRCTWRSGGRSRSLGGSAKSRWRGRGRRCGTPRRGRGRGSGASSRGSRRRRRITGGRWTAAGRLGSGRDR
jgi:hypothetical protein